MRKERPRAANGHDSGTPTNETRLGVGRVALARRKAGRDKYLIAGQRHRARRLAKEVIEHGGVAGGGSAYSGPHREIPHTVVHDITNVVEDIAAASITRHIIGLAPVTALAIQKSLGAQEFTVGEVIDRHAIRCVAVGETARTALHPLVLLLREIASKSAGDDETSIPAAWLGVKEAGELAHRFHPMLLFQWWVRLSPQRNHCRNRAAFLACGAIFYPQTNVPSQFELVVGPHLPTLPMLLVMLSVTAHPSWSPSTSLSAVPTVLAWFSVEAIRLICAIWTAKSGR